MSKKVAKGKAVKANHVVGYKHYLFPSLIGGVIAWYFSESLALGIVVAVAVMIGNYFGFKMLQKK